MAKTPFLVYFEGAGGEGLSGHKDPYPLGAAFSDTGLIEPY